MNKDFRFSLLALALLSLSVAGCNSQERFVTVSGLCRKEIAPDRNALLLSAEVMDADTQVASTRATEIFEKIRQKIKELNIKDIELETSEFSVNEEREWVKERYISRGYKARASLRVSSSDFSFAPKVVGIALAEGVKDIGSLETFISNKLLDQTRFECLEEAVTNARAKARRMTETASAKLGEVMNIQESDGDVQSPPMPRMMSKGRGGMEMAAAPMMDGPTIETRKTTVSTSVNVTFSIKN